MKRIFLFLATNLAVLVLLSLGVFVVERVFGVHLAGSGLGGLLVFAAICAINTDSTHGFMRLFMTHPPIDERIAALQHNP